MDVTIITGLSGAGKSQAANVLEDIGFFCIDNVPPALIPKIVDIMLQLETFQKVVIVTDARTGELFSGFLDCLNELKKLNANCKILFLDADDEVLARRYSESRRKHPLVTSDKTSVREAIKSERRLISPVLNLADYYVDTSLITPAQLKKRILSIFSEDEAKSMLITCMSFGFKHGVPPESDLVFDVRCLPNPFYVPELTNKTGLDEPVSKFVWGNEQSEQMFKLIASYVEYTLPLYKDEGKSQLVISVGCTGGHHRSVCFAERISAFINEMKFDSRTIHRDITK